MTNMPYVLRSGCEQQVKKCVSQKAGWNNKGGNLGAL